MYDTTDDFADNIISATEVFEAIMDNANFDLRRLKTEFPADSVAAKMIDTVLAYGKYSLDSDDTAFLLSGQDAAMQSQILADYVQEFTEGLPQTHPVRLRVLKEAAIAKSIAVSMIALQQQSCGFLDANELSNENAIQKISDEYKKLKPWEKTDINEELYRQKMSDAKSTLNQTKRSISVCEEHAWVLYNKIILARKLKDDEAYKKKLKDNGYLEKVKNGWKDFYGKGANLVNIALSYVNTGGADSGNSGSSDHTAPAPAPAPAPAGSVSSGNVLSVYGNTAYDPETGIWYDRKDENSPWIERPPATEPSTRR